MEVRRRLHCGSLCGLRCARGRSIGGEPETWGGGTLALFTHPHPMPKLDHLGYDKNKDNRA